MDIDKFLKERDEALISGDITKVMAFHNLYNPEKPMTDPKMAEIVLHKGRTACLSLPLEVRKKSKAWLTLNGFHSMDDGDL